MRNNLLVTLLLTGLLVGKGVYGAGSPGTIKPDPYWPFSSETKMDGAIREHAADPNATYYVIIRAWQMHKAAQATLVYREILMKSPEDPYLESAYGFCQMLSYSNLSGDVATDPNPDRGKADALQIEAEYYRDKAFKAKPNDLFILLERGIDLGYQYSDSAHNRREEAVACLQKAVALAPTWGIAHVWYADCLILASAVGHMNDMKELSLKALDEYELAAKLDSGLQVQALEGEAQAYGNLNQNTVALKCLNEAIVMNPELTKNVGLVHWQKYLAAHPSSESK